MSGMSLHDVQDGVYAHVVVVGFLPQRKLWMGRATMKQKARTANVKHEHVHRVVYLVIYVEHTKVALCMYRGKSGMVCKNFVTCLLVRVVSNKNSH